MIRQYQTDDTNALVAIWQLASDLAHSFLDDAFLAAEAIALRERYLPNAETWVLEDQGRPVGFIALVGDEIGGLYLDPAAHGRGLGKAMVDHVAGLKGPLHVEVFEKNGIGRRFYDRYGFIEVTRYRHEASGEVTLRMKMPV